MENEKLTYQQIENQLVELKKENEILRANATHHDKEVGRAYFYNNILDNIGEPVFVKDEESRILIFNTAFRKIFDLESGNIIGKTLAEHVSPDEREVFLRIDNQVIADGIENVNEESLTVRGGETRIISTKKTRFIDSDGKKYLVGVIHDITERKKSENAIKDSEEQLKELNATKDKLFSIIAHDLRSPFNSIIGLSDFIMQNRDEFEKSEQYIKMLNSTAKNTLILLENLLNWAQAQSGKLSFKPQKILSSTLFQETITLEKPLAKSKNITLDYLPSDDIEVYADENMLKTVMRNLISNSIKFTEIGGRIQVVETLKKDHVEITISDNGIGMNSEQRQGLFNIASNVSTRGTANENGSGLGLVLCKEFIEKNGGKIWVESKVGKGSDFKFTLPLGKSV